MTDHNICRRTLLKLSGAGGLASVSGCLRLISADDGSGSTSTGRPSQTASDVQTDRPSSTETRTTTEQTTDQASSLYPTLDLEYIEEIEAGSRRTPASDMTAVDDAHFATAGGTEVSIYRYDTLSKVASTRVPYSALSTNLNGTNHALSVADGEVYAAVGGGGPAQVLRLSRDGEVWRFEENHFGQRTNRTVTAPVVTEEYVVVTIPTTRNRDGENDFVWYVLDNATGEMVAAPDTEEFDNPDCFVSGLGETNQTVVLGGCSQSYFYDLNRLEYTGSIDGTLGSCILGDEGVFYGSLSAVNADDGSLLWRNNNSICPLEYTEEFIYGSSNSEIVKIKRRSGDTVFRTPIEKFAPIRYDLATDAIWIATDNTDSEVGRIIRLSLDGNIIGAYKFNPQKTNLVRPYPKALLQKGSHLYVGSGGSIVKYRV